MMNLLNKIKLKLKTNMLRLKILKKNTGAITGENALTGTKDFIKVLTHNIYSSLLLSIIFLMTLKRNTILKFFLFRDLKK